MANAINQAIDSGKTEFVGCEKFYFSKKDGFSKEEFIKRKSFINKLDRVIIYSDRSPCDDKCKPFFENLLSGVRHDIGFAYKYGRGLSVSGLDLRQAKPIIDERKKIFDELCRKIVEEKEKLEKEIG